MMGETGGVESRERRSAIRGANLTTRRAPRRTTPQADAARTVDGNVEPQRDANISASVANKPPSAMS
jgi:hypothetical protein